MLFRNKKVEKQNEGANIEFKLTKILLTMLCMKLLCVKKRTLVPAVNVEINYRKH